VASQHHVLAEHIYYTHVHRELPKIVSRCKVVTPLYLLLALSDRISQTSIVDLAAFRCVWEQEDVRIVMQSNSSSSSDVK
jgi:hypothetical protein